MADFRQDLWSCNSQAVSYSYTDVNMEVLNQVAELSPSILVNFNISDFSIETSLACQEPEFSASNAQMLLGTFQSNGKSAMPIDHCKALTRDDYHERKKRKMPELLNGSFEKNYSTASGNEKKVKNDTTEENSIRKGKNGRDREKEVDKSKDVIQVRAKRGQATDSHSLAERVRREKIKNRLRRLQDLVPGCYKTMGMAVMLDEIINYVHSLQNQVEFLSMELAAATSFYDFNLESEAISKSTGAPSRTFRSSSQFRQTQIFMV